MVKQLQHMEEHVSTNFRTRDGIREVIQAVKGKLGVGPIDVQQASLDHVLGLLQRWRAPTVTLRLVREDDS